MVRVIIPVREHRKYLERCLKSVLDEGQRPYVVDFSEDTDVERFIRPYGYAVDYVKAEATGTMAGDWNAAIDLCGSEGWIHLLHDDDLVMPGFYKSIESAPSDCVAVAQGYICVNTDNEVTFRQVYSEEANGPFVRRAAFDWLSRGNSLQCCAVAFRGKTQFRGELMRFDTDASMWYVIDWDYWLRLADSGAWWIVPEIGAVAQEHDARETVRRHSERYASINYAIERWENRWGVEKFCRARALQCSQALSEAMKAYPNGDWESLFKAACRLRGPST